MAITNGYATLADLKASTRITDSVDDGLLEYAIESASRQIDSYAQRNFYAAGTASRVFAPNDGYLLEIDDLVTITKLETSDGTNFNSEWAAGDYQLEPLNGIVDGLTGYPATRIRAIQNNMFNPIEGNATVRITGTWGWAAVPIAIKQATILQASRIFKRNDSPLGVAGFGDLGAIRVSAQLDPDVRMMVEPYRKVRFA